MKLLHELLGFVVLTGPLFLIIAWLPLCVWVAVKVSKRFTRSAARLASGVVVFSIVFAVPFADEIVGRIYFHHLCSTKAGVKIYQTVELPAKYWDERGKPRFFNKSGYLKHKFWVNKVAETDGRVTRYSPIFNIDRDSSTVVEKETHLLLGAIVTFRYWGGWVRKKFSPSNTAVSCGFIHDPGFSRDFYSKLFRPPHSSK